MRQEDNKNFKREYHPPPMHGNSPRGVKKGKGEKKKKVTK